ncbi:phasin family protein [Magnetococcus sp. PR-3]|uniref:phasin family protein n=1 Tax=Magnetococcus sp. PR-3 TaxID=3120355 RepID=UPI002FCE1CDF
MDNKFAQQWNDATKSLLDNMNSFQKINESAFQKLAQQQITLANLYINNSVSQVKLLGEVKDAREVMNRQAELAKSFGEEMVKHANATVELMNETRGEVATLVEQNLEAVVNSAKAGE